MFLNCFKYAFIDYLRNKVIVFWVVFFPMILGILFNIAFMNIYNTESLFKEIPIAIIENGDEGGVNKLIEEMSETDSTKLFLVHHTNDEEAKKMLENGEIYGIIYDDLTEPSLSVRSENSIQVSILKSFLERYRVSATIIKDVAINHPEKLKDVVEALNIDTSSMMELKNLGRGNNNPFTTYFYNLLAMACMFMSMIGQFTAINNQANLSDIGARICVSPIKKITKFSASLLAAFIIFYIGICVATAFLFFVLRIDFGINYFEAILVNAFGSLVGLSLGFFVGCIGRMSSNLKQGILLGISLGTGFLSGLMVGDMPLIIEANCPIINRINPSRLISDSFYTINSYGICNRLYINLGTLLIMSILFFICGSLLVSKRKFKSI